MPGPHIFASIIKLKTMRKDKGDNFGKYGLQPGQIQRAVDQLCKPDCGEWFIKRVLVGGKVSTDYPSLTFVHQTSSAERCADLVTVDAKEQVAALIPGQNQIRDDLRMSIQYI